MHPSTWLDADLLRDKCQRGLECDTPKAGMRYQVLGCMASRRVELHQLGVDERSVREHLEHDLRITYLPRQLERALRACECVSVLAARRRDHRQCREEPRVQV